MSLYYDKELGDMIDKLNEVVERNANLVQSILDRLAALEDRTRWAVQQLEKKRWVQFTRRTNNPKLAWLKKQLTARGIEWKEQGESFHAPILWVRDEQEASAWDTLDPVDELPDDHPMFKE